VTERPTCNPSGTCEQCDTWVPVVKQDHTVPLSEGGAHDTSNLRWLCSACELAKTREDARRASTGRVLSDEALRKLAESQRLRLAALTPGQRDQWRANLSAAHRGRGTS
jgi:5-methylcytosine-specific restriction endonuclease McrA